MPDGFTKVASAADIGENESRSFRVGSYDILVCKTEDGFFAVENRCTHQLSELEGGKIRGCVISCPLHGQRFNLKDGTPIGPLTDEPIKTFPLRVEDGAVFIRPQPNDPPAGGPN